MKYLSWYPALTGLVAAAIGATLFATRDTVTVNGKAASVETRVIGGSTYVKLSDMANALGMVLVKRGGGRYELAMAGGANQIGSLVGKIGDTLFDGKWRFTVISVETVASFTMKSDSEPYGASGEYEWNRTKRLLTPSRSHRLVVVRCRVKNGTPEKRTLWTAISDERIRTALTDMNAGSYAPVAYDYAGAPIQSAWILPGAQLSFPVIFSVPEGTTVKDLVFTLKNNQGDEKGVDVRVSIAKD